MGKGKYLRVHSVLCSIAVVFPGLFLFVECIVCEILVVMQGPFTLVLDDFLATRRCPLSIQKRAMSSS
jgi:hypothetical protein